MSLFFRRQNAEKQYIHLIKQASEKWPNWDPAKKLDAGDFGTLDKKTGKLTVEGNIYTHPEIEDIAKHFGEVRGAMIDHYQIQSHQMDGIDVNANANLGQKVVFQAGWEVNTSCGAILVMHKPRMKYVPDRCFTALNSLNLSILKDKSVVYQAWDCPGYAMYFIDGKRQHKNFTVRLCENLTTSGAHLDFNWEAEGSSSVHQKSYDPESREVYTPLYCLRSMKKKRRWGLLRVLRVD